MDQQNKTVKAEAIKSQEYEIQKTKEQIKTRKELIAESIETRQAWLDLESAKAEAVRFKEKLNQELLGDRDYNNQLEDLGQLKEKLKDQKETMSDLVVGYFIDTEEKQIETDSNGDAREIIIKGSLGKTAKFQTSIFKKSM
jgi:hypothetical protein